MTTESIRIPPERIVPIATEAASNAKAVAGVLGFFLVLFAIAALGMPSDDKVAAGGTAYNAGRMVGGSLWFIVLGAITWSFIKKGKRATAAAELAKTSSGYEFVLSGKEVLVMAPGGIPDPNRSFKVSGKLRTMLLAAPQATVVRND